MSDLWNAAIDHVAEAFEKKHNALGKIERKSNVMSWETGAAVVRSHRRDPEPPRLVDEVEQLESDLERIERVLRDLSKRIDYLEAQAKEVPPIADLAERHRRLVTYVLKHIGGDVDKATRAKLNLGG